MILFGRLYIKWLPSRPQKPVVINFDGKRRPMRLYHIYETFREFGASGLLYVPPEYDAANGVLRENESQPVLFPELSLLQVSRYRAKDWPAKNASSDSTEVQA